jgi:hypothetical protein
VETISQDKLEKPGLMLGPDLATLGYVLGHFGPFFTKLWSTSLPDFKDNKTLSQNFLQA